MALRPMDRSDSKHLFLWIFRLFYREWAGKGGRFEEDLRERRVIHISSIFQPYWVVFAWQNEVWK